MRSRRSRIRAFPVQLAIPVFNDAYTTTTAICLS